MSDEDGQHIATDPPREPVKLTWWKLLLFAGATVAVFFVLLEVVLALSGVKPAQFSSDPYVGFASNIPLYVKETGLDGQDLMVTASNKRGRFNVQRFPMEKPPGTFRIFCLGGSTTFGRPYDDKTSFCGWLRELLPVADSSRQWELINAGGVSYASYRVALLMEELIQYEPDLFIIYSGHNESLERRTYQRVIEAPQLLTGVGAILSRTRSYAAVQKIAAAFSNRRTDESPTMLRAEVDAILDHTIGPTAYTRDDAHQKQVFAHYRVNLNRMVDIAGAAGADVVFVTPASNLKDCSPFKSEHRADLGDDDIRQFTTRYERARDAQKEGRLNDALSALEAATIIDDRFADLHYLKGLVLHDLGHYDQAKAAFMRAIDEDVCPLRSGTLTQQIVAEVAAQRNVPIVNCAKMVEDLSEHGIPGSDYFPDHAHLTIEGYRLLALRLIQVLEAQRIVKTGPSWDDAAIVEVTQNVESRIDNEAHGAALRNLALIFSWAGKLNEAERMAAQASELLGEDAESYHVRALSALARGDSDEEIRLYRRALRLKPDLVNAHYNLANALRSQGELDEAVKHYRRVLELKFDFAEAHFNLAGALRSLGELDGAIQHYRGALQLTSGNADVHFGLANTLRSQGKLDGAVKHYEEAVKLTPDDALMRYETAVTLDRAGESEQALEYLRDAVRLKPNWSAPLNAMSWILATHPSAHIRDPNEAVDVAQHAAKAAESPDPAILDTLAAAYAAAGQFDHAVETAEAALTIATDTQLAELAAQIRDRLALYRQEKPYRQSQ